MLNQLKLNKMKEEFEQLQRKKSAYKSRNNQLDTEINDFSIDFEQMVPFSSDFQDSLSQSKFFGYDFFLNRDTVNFFNNLPAPPNYIIGPGDELRISIWGETQIRQTYIVSERVQYMMKSWIINSLSVKT